MSFTVSLHDLANKVSLFSDSEKAFISRVPDYIVKAFSSIGIEIDTNLFSITKSDLDIVLFYEDENLKFKHFFNDFHSKCFFSLDFYNNQFLHDRFKSCPNFLSPIDSTNKLQFRFQANSDFSLDSYFFSQYEDYNLDDDYISVGITKKFDHLGNITGFVKYIESNNPTEVKYDDHVVHYDLNDIAYDELVFILEWQLLSLTCRGVHALVPDVLDDYVMDYSEPNTIHRFALAEMIIS